MRGATCTSLCFSVLFLFQSTLPYAGSDNNAFAFAVCIKYFNPRSPMRGATASWGARSGTSYFNPRSPMRGATSGSSPSIYRASDFNPRSPMRGATTTAKIADGAVTFQSTLPYAGSDAPTVAERVAVLISIHAPLCGERRCPGRGDHPRTGNFNPRSPMRGATL